MRRREFIIGVAGAAAWPLMARAQQADGVRRIGVLGNTPEPDQKDLRQALRELGWIEGRTSHLSGAGQRVGSTICPN